MKKMIKWSAILGVIFCLAGIGVITAGAMMGGADEMGRYLPPFDSYYKPYRNQAIKIEDRIVDKIEDKIGDGAVPGTDKVINSMSYDHVRKLSIEAGPGEVVVVTEDRADAQDTSIRIEGYAEDGVLTYPYEIRMDEDELEIERNLKFRNVVGPFQDHSDDYQTGRMEALVVYIPRNYQFREVEIEAAASSVSIDEIRTDKLGLELMAGSLTIDNGVVGELDAECRAGSIYIVLEGKKEQFNYELTSNVGSIVLTDGEEERYEGLRREKHIDNRAGKYAELECDAGELYIEFTEPGV